MSINALKEIKKGMTAAGVNYEYQEWTTKPVYPYFVGEYQETESVNEDGCQETTFILTGFTRGSYLELEQKKELIRQQFDSVKGHKAIADDGSAIAVFYASALGNIPTGDAELKKIQINLTIKEWKVN